jgi:nitrate/TMAO reductase-like tetraheme cytochrome c subunit
VRLRLPVAIRNTVSLIGMAIATAMAFVFLALFLLEAFGYLPNPYIGIVVFIMVPLFFLAGLVLVPVGAWWSARRRHVAPGAVEAWPVIDLRDPHQRHVLVIVLALTLVNVLLVSMAAYGGVHYMETARFCGQVCHATMEPEYSAHQVWPHARVPCVDCHVGSSAEALVESKVSGTRQLAMIALGRIPKPIPVPVTNMRPARDTCEQCHWPEKLHGDAIRVTREYANDEANTESVTTLRLHVGGGSRTLGVGTGIHWHMNLDNQVEYIAADDKRESIPYVRVTDRSGQVREYVVAGTPADLIASGPRRRMDCIDCHNRPAHTFFATAERAVDAAMASGGLPRELPLVRREAVAAITASYVDRADALGKIAQRLGDFYRARAGVDRRLVDRAIAMTQDVWARNVFPGMNVSWGTYPNFIGHVDAPGCFRCHDDEHKTTDGKAISQDCELCHSIE